MLLILLIKIFAMSENSKNVLGIRRLIIEDASGREIILMGVPMPSTRNRVRTEKGEERLGKTLP